MAAGDFVRFQGSVENRRGVRPGVFALVNGLLHDGLLTEPEAAFTRHTNQWYDTYLPDPGVLAPWVYDRDLHPRAAAWFKLGEHPFFEPVPQYLRILDARGIGHEMVMTTDPGSVLYEDPFQVVAQARSHADHVRTGP